MGSTTLVRLENLVVLPSQWHAKVDDWPGEKKLLGAVLEDAMNAVRKGKKEQKDQVLAWATDRGEDVENWMPFRWLCAELGISASAVLRQFKREYDRAVHPPIRHTHLGVRVDKSVTGKKG